MKRKLIIHIGMGKTGSSSIQSTLRDNSSLLAKNGIAYLGLMLEYAEKKKFDWQKVYGWPTFREESKDIANKQLIDIFTHIEKDLSPEITTLIWSNESLFGNIELISPALLCLDEIFDVQAIGYIRRPDSWIASAYIQWGIKHKSYTGPLQRFKKWVTKRPFSLVSDIQKWISMFSQSYFYNFDTIDNVAQHFIQKVICIDSTDLTITQANVTPSPVSVALYAYYNSFFDGKTHPREIEPLLNNSGVLNQNNSIGSINNYFPKEEDIRAYLDNSAGELEEINKIFKQLGEPEIDVSEIKVNEFIIKQPDMNRALFLIIVYLSNRVDRLENLIFNKEK